MISKILEFSIQLSLSFHENNNFENIYVRKRVKRPWTALPVFIKVKRQNQSNIFMIDIFWHRNEAQQTAKGFLSKDLFVSSLKGVKRGSRIRIDQIFLQRNM